MAASPAARRLAQREKERGGMLIDERELGNRNKSAFGVILGETRVTAADIMFTKTERYLHSGMAYAPHLNLDEAVHRDAEHAAHEGHEGHESLEDDELFEHVHDLVPLIRNASDDFRGFLGDLERSVKPYREPGYPDKHTEGRELLPWFRMMAIANPRNVSAYLIGSMWLTQSGKWDEAVAFIQEGIDANDRNPELFRLYSALATLHAKSRHHDEWGDEDWAEKCFAAADKGYRLALDYRPKLGQVDVMDKGLMWRLHHEEEFLFAARYRIALLRDGKKIDEAIAAANELLALAPDDGVTKRALTRLQQMKEE